MPVLASALLNSFATPGGTPTFLANFALCAAPAINRACAGDLLGMLFPLEGCYSCCYVMSATTGKGWGVRNRGRRVDDLIIVRFNMGIGSSVRSLVDVSKCRGSGVNWCST